MIITHMPTKLAVVVGLVIIAALSAYYVVYLAVGPDEAWQVYQGSGCVVPDPAVGDHFELEAKDATRGPWFAFVGLEAPVTPIEPAQQAFMLGFSARSRTGCRIPVVLQQRGGETFERTLVLVPSQEWARVVLPLTSFVRRPDDPVPSVSEEDTTEEASAPAPGELGPTVTFELVENADAERELELTRPVLDRVVSP